MRNDNYKRWYHNLLFIGLMLIYHNILGKYFSKGYGYEMFIRVLATLILTIISAGAAITLFSERSVKILTLILFVTGLVVIYV